MSKFQRDKGKRGEREVAAILRDHGYSGKRGVQYHGGPESPDVIGLPGIHIEVKRVERLDLKAAYNQSRDDSDGDIPIVVHRKSREPWMVTLSFEDFLDILKNQE
jgi:hypothetical protein